MATTTATPEQTYRAAKTETRSASAACRAVMLAHGLSAKDAADLSWAVETGKPAPIFEHADGSPTAAAFRHEAGRGRKSES